MKCHKRVYGKFFLNASENFLYKKNRKKPLVINGLLDFDYSYLNERVFFTKLLNAFLLNGLKSKSIRIVNFFILNILNQSKLDKLFYFSPLLYLLKAFSLPGSKVFRIALKSNKMKYLDLVKIQKRALVFFFRRDKKVLKKICSEIYYFNLVSRSNNLHYLAMFLQLFSSERELKEQKKKKKGPVK